MNHFSFEDRARPPFAGAVQLAAQKIEFVFPARLETYQREQHGLLLLRPVGDALRRQDGSLL